MKMKKKKNRPMPKKEEGKANENKEMRGLDVDDSRVLLLHEFPENNGKGIHVCSFIPVTLIRYFRFRVRVMVRVLTGCYERKQRQRQRQK